MVDRTVTVRVRADVAQAKRELEALGYTVEDAGKKAMSSGDALEKTGDVAAKAGLAGAAGLGLMAKSAIDWETAWAGVTKTVDGTDEQMDQLEDQLRGLASDTLPATHEEIAGVAEAAGQLGVKRQDIAGFTKTMIDLGESTNLTADEAATSLAQIGNVMGTMSREGQVGVQRLGSTLVALGNDGASTEKDIVQMAQRIAGAGKVVGASESDVLALANAMSSLGIEAQLGGGVMSRVLIDINSSVKEGGGALQAYADVAGVSASEFSQAWENDPVRAVDSFIQGLARIQAEGGDVAGVLKDLGLKGTENASVLLRLTGAGDMLTRSLDLGNKAWQDNTALVIEASKRYDTTASKLKIARNSVNDAAISLGDVLLPAVTNVSEKVGDMARGFSDLDPEVQSTIVKLAGLVTGVLLTVGAASKGIAAYRTAKGVIEAFGVSGAKSGKLLGKAAVGFAAAATAVNVLTDNAQEVSVEGLTRQILDSGNAVDGFSQVIKDNAAEMGYIQDDLQDFGDVLRTTFDPGFWDGFSSKGDTVFKTLSLGMVDMTTTTDEAEMRLNELDATLTNLAQSGNAQQASVWFNQLSAAAKEQGVSVDQLLTSLPKYKEYLDGVSNGQQLAGDTGSTAADGFGEVQTAAEEAQESTQDFADTLNDLNGTQLDARAATREVAQALLDAKEAAKEARKGLNDSKDGFDLTTQAGIDAQAALDNVAQAMGAQLDAAVKAGAGQKELDSTLRTSRDELYKTARRFGLSEDAARDYVEEVLAIPPAKNTDVTINAAEVKAQAARIQSWINGIHGKDVNINVRYNAGKLPNGGRDLTGGITKADGGPVWGAGTSTSDSIHAMLSNGEYVVRAAAVQQYGLGFLDRVNSMRLAAGGYAGAMPPTAAFSPATGPLQLVGTLDLGDGIRGVVRGELRSAALEASRSR